MENKELFKYDRTIYEADFCNFQKERDILINLVEEGKCVKLFGPRNFGKTSMAKNIIAKKWEEKHKSKRVVVYADFFSVESLEDISLELMKSFTESINSKKNVFSKSIGWLSELKSIRPTWTPSSSSELGEFSIALEGNKAVSFEAILESIHSLQLKKQFEFLLILDEFQEISKVKKAEAKLRGALQKFSTNIPIIILGSKQHMLAEIFEKPKAPFYSWGMTIEFNPIDYMEYFQYMNERFLLANKSIDQDTSIYLQDKLKRIPEAINRFCDYILKNYENNQITSETIDSLLGEFIEQSRSIYEHIFSELSKTERQIVIALSIRKKVKSILGKDFLSAIHDTSKSTVGNIAKKLLNNSTISIDHEQYYMVTDPFFEAYIIRYKA